MKKYFYGVLCYVSFLSGVNAQQIRVVLRDDSTYLVIKEEISVDSENQVKTNSILLASLNFKRSDFGSDFPSDLDILRLYQREKPEIVTRNEYFLKFKKQGLFASRIETATVITATSPYSQKVFLGKLVSAKLNPKEEDWNLIFRAWAVMYIYTFIMVFLVRSKPEMIEPDTKSDFVNKFLEYAKIFVFYGVGLSKIILLTALFIGTFANGGEVFAWIFLILTFFMWLTGFIAFLVSSDTPLSFNLGRDNFWIWYSIHSVVFCVLSLGVVLYVSFANYV